MKIASVGAGRVMGRRQYRQCGKSSAGVSAVIAAIVPGLEAPVEDFADRARPADQPEVRPVDVATVTADRRPNTTDKIPRRTNRTVVALS